MTSSESKIIKLYDEVTLGNSDALRFLFHWNLFCHAIDDLIDGPDRAEPEDVVSAFAEANVLYTLPFYQANCIKLQTTVMLITNSYADSIGWEKSEKDGHRKMADVLRFAGNEMVFAVALICGGYQHMRRVSAGIRERSWMDHHKETGEAK